MAWNVGTLSSYQFNLFSRQNVQRTSLELQKSAQEVSSGKKADIYADLGPRATSVMRMRAREADNDTYMSANEVLGNKLQAMLTSIDAARGQLESVLQTAITNSENPKNGAEVLQEQARAAMESLVATLNTSYNGEYLFSGLQSDRAPLMRWSEVNAGTGLSPADAMASLFGAGPVDAATATAIADQIDLAFSDSDVTIPARNFEATFYNGSPALDGGGSPTRQVNAWVSSGQEIVYGVRANDAPFRDAVKGLAMLAVTDVSQMDEAAYSTYMARTVDALSSATQGLLDASARVGFNQQVVETTQSQLTDISVVRRTQISNYESVDPYEAISRMQALETQLQASYQVSAQLSGLTILNFIR